MPDNDRPFQLLNTDGTPANVPDGAIANEHKKGAIKFAPGGQVPVTIAGQPYTIPSEHVDDAVTNYAAQLDTGSSLPYAALGGVPFASTVVPWAAKNLLNDPEQAERLKKGIAAAEQEHPVAALGAGVLGAFGTTALTGGAAGPEAVASVGAEAGALGADAANIGRVAGEASKAYEAAKVAASAQAAAGRTIGGTLTSALKYANPFYTGAKVGEAATALAPASLPGVGRLAGFAAEGAFYGAANAVDESSLGDHELTAEALRSNMEYGALFGGGLGLVSTAAGKVLTSAGRMAGRIQDAKLGGSPTELRKGIQRFGRGTLGRMEAEWGAEPWDSPEDKLALAEKMAEQYGQGVEAVVKEGDANYAGVRAEPLVREMQEMAYTRGKDLEMAGGNGRAVSDRVMQDFKDTIDYKDMPEPPKAISDSRAEDIYQDAKRKTGLPDLPDAPPDPPSTRDLRNLYERMADAAGIGARREKPITNFRREMGADFQQWQQRVLQDPALRTKAFAADGGRASFLGELNAAIEGRNAQRGELYDRADKELAGDWWQQRSRYVDLAEADNKLRAQAEAQVMAERAEQTRLHAAAEDLVRRHNADLKVPRETIWRFRQKVDDLIPWKGIPTPTTNAAVEMKLGMRRVLENRMEQEFDASVNKSGDAPLRARYAHAKEQYSQAKAIEEMKVRNLGKESAAYGRITKWGSGLLPFGALASAALGHPAMGVATGLGSMAYRKYGPSVGAWAISKVARYAEIRALRAEVEVAVRRSTRAAAMGGKSSTARVAIPEMPPHQLRMTAAEAMWRIKQEGNDPSRLAARLAAFDPSFSIIAPNTSASLANGSQRALMYLMAKIPQHIAASDRKPGADDISDEQARNFMQTVAIAHDARYAPDMASHGNLTPQMALDHRALWPVTAAQNRATLQRMGTDDRALPHQAKLLVGSQPSVPGFAVALQASAARLAAGSGPQTQPKGMTHASAGFKQLTAGASGLSTMSQMAESGAPGRRGRAGHPSSISGI